MFADLTWLVGVIMSDSPPPNSLTHKKRLLQGLSGANGGLLGPMFGPSPAVEGSGQMGDYGVGDISRLIHELMMADPGSVSQTQTLHMTKHAQQPS